MAGNACLGEAIQTKSAMEESQYVTEVISNYYGSADGDTSTGIPLRRFSFIGSWTGALETTASHQDERTIHQDCSSSPHEVISTVRDTECDVSTMGTKFQTKLWRTKAIIGVTNDNMLEKNLCLLRNRRLREATRIQHSVDDTGHETRLAEQSLEAGDHLTSVYSHSEGASVVCEKKMARNCWTEDDSKTYAAKVDACTKFSVKAETPNDTVWVTGKVHATLASKESETPVREVTKTTRNTHEYSGPLPLEVPEATTSSDMLQRETNSERADSSQHPGSKAPHVAARVLQSPSPSQSAIRPPIGFHRRSRQMSIDRLIAHPGSCQRPFEVQREEHVRLPRLQIPNSEASLDSAIQAQVPDRYSLNSGAKVAKCGARLKFVHLARPLDEGPRKRTPIPRTAPRRALAMPLYAIEDINSHRSQISGSDATPTSLLTIVPMFKETTPEGGLSSKQVDDWETVFRKAGSKSEKNRGVRGAQSGNSKEDGSKRGSRLPGLFSKKFWKNPKTTSKQGIPTSSVCTPSLRIYRPDVYYEWNRFSPPKERAIYSMGHHKLTDPRRALYSQVLLSNLMHSYLNKVQAERRYLHAPNI